MTGCILYMTIDTMDTMDTIDTAVGQYFLLDIHTLGHIVLLIVDESEDGDAQLCPCLRPSPQSLLLVTPVLYPPSYHARPNHTCTTTFNTLHTFLVRRFAGLDPSLTSILYRYLDPNTQTNAEDELLYANRHYPSPTTLSAGHKSQKVPVIARTSSPKYPNLDPVMSYGVPRLISLGFHYPRSTFSSTSTFFVHHAITLEVPLLPPSHYPRSTSTSFLFSLPPPVLPQFSPIIPNSSQSSPQSAPIHLHPLHPITLEVSPSPSPPPITPSSTFPQRQHPPPLHVKLPLLRCKIISPSSPPPPPFPP